MSVTSQKLPPFIADVMGGNSYSPPAARSGEYEGCSNVVTLSFAKKSFTKPTGVLEHCREEETKIWFSIFRGVSF
jgi:hypothetical protein